MAVIPQTYTDWEECITVRCGIPLTADFVAGRIKALEDKSDYHTQKFIEAWGEDHRVRTLGWFREAETRLRKSGVEAGEALPMGKA